MALQEEITIQKSVLIKHSQKDLFQIIYNFENLPLILDFLENVMLLNTTHSRWTAKISEEERITWDVEITREKEDEFIEWHSSGNTDILHEGTFRFSHIDSRKGTVLSLLLRFYFPPRDDSKSNMLGEDFENRIQDNLIRFKQAIEANEFPRPRQSKKIYPEGLSPNEGSSKFAT